MCSQDHVQCSRRPCSRGALYLGQDCRSEREDAQLHKQIRLWATGRVMGESRAIHGILLGALLPVGRAINIRQTYGSSARKREAQRSLLFFSKAAFVRSLPRLIAEIQAESLVPDGAGARAQALLRCGGDLGDDLLILKTASTVHGCNAPSPAATAAREIGRAIVDQLPPS